MIDSPMIPLCFPRVAPWGIIGESYGNVGQIVSMLLGGKSSTCCLGANRQHVAGDTPTTTTTTTTTTSTTTSFYFCYYNYYYHCYYYTYHFCDYNNYYHYDRYLSHLCTHVSEFHAIWYPTMGSCYCVKPSQLTADHKEISTMKSPITFAMPGTRKRLGRSFMQSRKCRVLRCAMHT